jgi:hypothetical protein
LNKNEDEFERLMREGQAAAKRGDKAMARVLLTQLLEGQPENEHAWMWLSGVVTDPMEQTTCLENVLILNPQNAQARKGLDFIRTRSLGTKDLTPPSAPVHVNHAPGMVAPFDPTAEDNNYQARPGAPEAVVIPEMAPPMPAPSNGAVSDFPDFLQVEQGGSPGQANAPHDAQPPVFDPSMLEAEVAPFSPPDDVPYTGGPPTPGLPPDMGAAMPDWVRTTNAEQSAEPPTGRHSAPSHNGSAEPAFDAFSLDSMDDAAPSAVVEASTGSSPETDLNAWLDELASSAKFNFEDQVQPDAGTTHLDVAGVPGPGLDPFSPQAGFPPDPFANPGPLDFAQVGPYGAAMLPSPDELPGDPGSSGQPWYLQSSNQSGYMPTPTNSGEDTTNIGQSLEGTSATATATNVATIECPYCFHHVPETSLACPECRYTFFVHCPHCHELVDTSVSKEGVVEPCPYCSVSINKWDLALNMARGLVMPHALAKESDNSWLGQPLEDPALRRGFNFGWLVDVMWLLIVVLMVWALTQLPTWLHLTDLYN